MWSNKIRKILLPLVSWYKKPTKDIVCNRSEQEDYHLTQVIKEYFEED